jgi:hypothetical protein
VPVTFEPIASLKTPFHFSRFAVSIFFAVYKGYYILTGRRLGGTFGTKLANKVSSTLNSAATG